LALSASEDPAPIFLLRAIEARRYQLPPDRVQEFTSIWQKAAGRKGTVGGVCEACKIMAGYFHLGAENLHDYMRDLEVEAYVRRNVRKKFTLPQLRQVCGILFVWNTDSQVLQQLVRKARKAHPEVAYFAYLAGEIEYERGPGNCNTRAALKAFRDALRLASHSREPEEIELVETIRDRIEVLQSFSFRRGYSPFAARYGRGGLRGEIDGFCDSSGLDPEELFRSMFGFIDDQSPKR
jgi:hypothetical protein